MKNVTLSGEMPKRKLIADITSSLILIFFVHSFITTYLHIKSLTNMLAFYTTNTTEVAWAIVTIEIVIAVLLFIPRLRMLGLIFSLLFAIAAILVIIRNPHLPHDFGGFVNFISRKQQYLLYLLLGILAVIGLGSYKSHWFQHRRGYNLSVKHN